MIKIDELAVEKSFNIFKQINRNKTASTELIKEYYETPGIIFLKKHLRNYGGLEFTEELLSHLLKEINLNKEIIPENNIFLKSMKFGLKYVDIVSKNISNIDFNEAIEKAINLASMYLPKKISEDCTIYLLYGVRGTGITLGNEMAIDICDEYLSRDGYINVERLINLIAHELHHIEVNKLLNKRKEKENNVKKQILFDFIGELMSEGVAYYYLPSPYNKDGILSTNWNNNIRNIDNILFEVSNYVEKILDGQIAKLNDIGQLFNDGLKGYTAGFTMVKLIDQTLGKEKVLSCLEDCFMFIEAYNQSLEEVNYKYPKIILK
ncbi:DUF5700 domain-containing putative Zn-dependent protease [Clostridium folliculivorans]|uniref:Uncharacterized protein n=1 Tax=Clostridium folliculivorans TaxID=2886038 RepID=A0A9W5Y6Q5_9CLOT|nr:DUF5700 domain-containing putative Zn-dependent protease [Clostridium folliculivorans]GKU27503.1 hypothetical protein CFOLD11_43300 [Clostridium folliculivorans]GKU32353.1 hypothetical protein CFB3_44610 [Clostridium folliculivorans]